MEEDQLREALRTGWRITPDELVRLPGGMNSATWRVVDGRAAWVAKLVPTGDRRAFQAGLYAAAVVEAGGLPAGAAIPTLDGDLTLGINEGLLALLAWVDGTPLQGTPGDAALIGTTLGAAHRLLSARGIPDAPQFDWIDVDAAHLGVEPWVRPAVAEVLREWAQLRPGLRAWGFLHGDPAPEAFLVSPDREQPALIDWSGMHGPLMYDVASALMYLGGVDRADDLLVAYLTSGMVEVEEAERALLPMLRLRWAVQADYFAWRLTANDLIGIADGRENHNGLDDARRNLENW